MIDFRIKICGVLSEVDVLACAAAGADCVGLNFYPSSVRYLDPGSTVTHAINDRARVAGLTRVGLFVNESAPVMLETFRDLGLDAIQLHGDETIDLAQTLRAAEIPIIRAVRLPTTALTPPQISDAIGVWGGLDVTLLLDADAGAAYGGGGRQLDWHSLAAWSQSLASAGETKNWILAGGLDGQNVATACRTSTANRVDVASGVESSRGFKSAALIQQFVAQYRSRGVDEPS